MEPKIFDLGGADGRWDGFLGPPKVTFALAVGNPPFIQAFEQGLREPGYVDGQNIAIEYRPWAGEEQLQLQAAELVRLKVDVLIAGTTQGPRRPSARPRLFRSSW